MVAIPMRDTDVVVTCNICGKSRIVNVDFQDIIAWRNGQYIQDVMDYLTDDERELLLSQTCGECFDKMYGEPLDNAE